MFNDSRKFNLLTTTTLKGGQLRVPTLAVPPVDGACIASLNTVQPPKSAARPETRGVRHSFQFT